MFDDHWYQHTTNASQLQTPQVPVSKGVAENTPNTTRAVINATKRKPMIPGPLQPEVPKRATSFEELKSGHGLHASALHKEPASTIFSHYRLHPTRSQEDIREFSKLQTVKRSQQITSQLDFSRWYGTVDEDVRNASLADFEALQSILQTYVSTCDSMLQETDSGLALLSTLQASFSAVRMHTSNFQGQCEDLIAEDQRLQALHENIADGLWPFNQLEGIVRKLHKPGVDFVRTEAFVDMLSTLDRCISFCIKHPDFADTLTYASRFRQCMTRALTLIRVYFVNSIKDSVTDIEKRLASLKTPSDSTRAALLHSKFRANASELQRLTAEIEKRCSHEEYRNILRECYSTFTTVRQRLIIPIVQIKLLQMSTSNTDLVSFARTGVSYIRTVCTDESELWRAFFVGGDIERFTFLQTIFAPFNDTIKPRIAKTTALKEICELCTLLQTTYQREQDEGDPNHFDHLHPQVEFGGLVQSTMQDTHLKIVECVKATIREQIIGFVPSQDDLDYPAKLKQIPLGKSAELDRLSSVVVESDDVASILNGSEMNTQAVFAGWYPTLRRTVWLLSRIYRLVNPTIFSDLAHQLVHACMSSLLKASETVKSDTGLVDGQLFLIKHLLILKEQMIAFDIEYIQPQAQAQKKEEGTASVTGRLTETLWNFYEKGSLFGKLVGSATVGDVVDAKLELDNRLRTIITEFCTYYSSKITEYLQDSPSIALHPKAQEPMQTIEDNCQRFIPELRDQLSAYIPEQRTRDALIGAVQDQVIEAYSKYVERMVKKDKRTVSLDKLWDIGVFVEWAHDTFGVRGYITESPDARSEVGSESGGSMGGSVRST